jgi:hypothetical protein
MSRFFLDDLLVESETTLFLGAMMTISLDEPLELFESTRVRSLRRVSTAKVIGRAIISRICESFESFDGFLLIFFLQIFLTTPLIDIDSDPALINFVNEALGQVRFRMERFEQVILADSP